MGTGGAVWSFAWALAGLGGGPLAVLLLQALPLCCKKKTGNSKAGKGNSVGGKDGDAKKAKKGDGGEVELEEDADEGAKKKAKMDEGAKAGEADDAAPKDGGPAIGGEKQQPAPAPPPPAAPAPPPEAPAPPKKKMASYQDQNYMTLAGLDEKNEELLPEDKQDPAAGGGEAKGGQFKVDDRIKKGRHVQAGNQNYMTLAGLNDEEVLPKDNDDGGDGGAKDGNFKVDDRIKKGRHVQAGNQNYMTLAGLQDEDELLPKDDDGVKQKGDGWKPPAFKGPFKVDDRIKKGRHVGAGNQNYLTLAGLADEDELLPKDEGGGGAPKGGPKGGGNFNVDERIKQGKKAPTKDPNYMTLAGLADDDELLPQDGPAPGGKAKGAKGGKFKVDDRIKQGKKAPTKDPNYMTLAGLQDKDEELLPKDSPAARPSAQPGGKGGKFKVDDRIKQGKKAPTKDPNYMTLAGLQDQDDQLLPKDR